MEHLRQGDEHSSDPIASQASAVVERFAAAHPAVSAGPERLRALRRWIHQVAAAIGQRVGEAEREELLWRTLVARCAAGDAPTPAFLERVADGERVLLSAWHTVGRDSVNTLPLLGRHVSKSHALITWSGEQWMLRDLHSRNGTRINGAALRPGRDVGLSAGMVLSFGEKSELWWVGSVACPVARAVALDGSAVRFAEGEILALPDDGAPEGVLFRDRDRSWCFEHAGGARQAAATGDTLSLPSGDWRLVLPDPLRQTDTHDEQRTPERLSLRLTRGPGQTPRRVRVLHRGEETELVVRAHHRLLMLLAAARVSDQRSGLPAAEHGWLDKQQLAQRLDIYDNNRLYVHIHRLRKQLAGAGVLDAVSAIERREDTCQIRLGISDIVLD